MARDAAIAARWAALGRMDRAALRVAWFEAFGEPSPHFLSMMFLRKALIWHEQCQRYGDLDPDLRRSLKALADGKRLRQVMASRPRPGTQLIREWNGRKYRVEVGEDGFVLDGESFKSLSAIALRITGTSWSGPRFFGLNGSTKADS